MQFDAAHGDELCLELIPGTALRPVTPDLVRLWESLADSLRPSQVEKLAEPKWALVWREGAAITSEPERSEHTTRIYFQQVPESKNSKNRVHLDLRLGAHDPAQVRKELVARGATILSTGAQGSHTWAVMADPEGNEFCV